MNHKVFADSLNFTVDEKEALKNLKRKNFKNIAGYIVIEGIENYFHYMVASVF